MRIGESSFPRLCSCMYGRYRWSGCMEVYPASKRVFLAGGTLVETAFSKGSTGESGAGWMAAKLHVHIT